MDTPRDTPAGTAPNRTFRFASGGGEFTAEYVDPELDPPGGQFYRVGVDNTYERKVSMHVPVADWPHFLRGLQDLAPS